jgi:hypothetical protein
MADPVSYTLHKFQEIAFLSPRQIIINAAGIQSGKTTTGSLWLGQKAMMQSQTDLCYLIIAPTYKILSQATLPKFLSIWGKYGRHIKFDQVFECFHGPKIYIRSMTDPESIEGITDVDGIWLDEGGMISKRDDVEFLNYRSIDNPYFPRAEYERQKKLLDPVRFKMKYDGVFGKMEGLVYPEVRVVPTFTLPEGTRYFAGVDWGYTDPFVITVRALTPSGTHYRVAEFYQDHMITRKQSEIALRMMRMYNIEMFVCDPSRPDSIDEFMMQGIPCTSGHNDIRAGIDAHLSLMNEDRFMVFGDLNPYGVDEYNMYHYPQAKDLKVDDHQKELLPVDKDNHGCDADRYVTLYVTSMFEDSKVIPIAPSVDGHIPEDNVRRAEWLKGGGTGS